jgi:hypothetical protein
VAVRAVNYRGAAVGDSKDDVLRYAESLERATEEAFHRVEVGYQRRFDVLTSKENAVTAKIGQMIVANGTLTLTLPASTSDNAGRSVAVVVLAGTVTLNSMNGQTINGAASATVAAAAMVRQIWSIGDRWMFEV